MSASLELVFEGLQSFQIGLEWLALVVSIIILISSLDDAFIDFRYWLGAIMRKLRSTLGWQKYFPELKEVLNAPEAPIAVMVPAWREADVIYDMISTNIDHLTYDNYRFFVGVYVNDPETKAEVERAQKDFPDMVEMVIVPHPGPTSKADCLNHVIRAVFAFEEERGEVFTGIALHDSEDVIHPYELSVFSYWLNQGYDMLQLPVYSFQRGLRDLVAGTYMDEFAEWHTKDLTVRQRMTGAVPCAGTSACFSRWAFKRLAEEDAYKGEIFNPSSLTEDYDIAFRLKKYGAKSYFLRYKVSMTLDVPEGATEPLMVQKTLPVATREYFPHDFRAAVRQRGRWLTGIIFQGWASYGWSGGLAMRYFFMRDRKGIITSPAAMLAYVTLLSFVFLESAYYFLPDGSRAPFTMLNTPEYMTLLVMNTVLLANRALNRAYFTTRIYGLGHGLMSVPRMVILNFLNFFALMRATRIYSKHLITGKPIGWDKTAHVFPTGIKPVKVEGS